MSLLGGTTVAAASRPLADAHDGGGSPRPRTAGGAALRRADGPAMTTNHEMLLAADGNSLVRHAHHAQAGTDLRYSDGSPLRTVRGVLAAITARFQPSAIGHRRRLRRPEFHCPEHVQPAVQGGLWSAERAFVPRTPAHRYASAMTRGGSRWSAPAGPRNRYGAEDAGSSRLVVIGLVSAVLSGALVTGGILVGGWVGGTSTSAAAGTPATPQTLSRVTGLPTTTSAASAASTSSGRTPPTSSAAAGDGLIAAPSLPPISTESGSPESTEPPLDARYLTTYVPGYMHLYNIKVVNSDGSPVPACDIAVQIMHLLQKTASPTHAQIVASLVPGGGLNDAFNQFTGQDPAGVQLLSDCALERVP
jgi:hypothetical protein